MGSLSRYNCEILPHPPLLRLGASMVLWCTFLAVVQYGAIGEKESARVRHAFS